MSSNEDRLEPLVTVRSEGEAAVVVNVLNDHDIKATADGMLTSQFRAAAPGGVRVLVRQEDLETARALLAEIPRDLGAERAARDDGSDDEPRAVSWAVRVVLLLMAISAALQFLVGLIERNAFDVAMGIIFGVLLVVILWARRQSPWPDADQTHRPQSPS